MTDNLDDHTLVINTFNRPGYLERLLGYVARDLPVGRVRVVDGSLEPWREQNRRVVAAFAEQLPIVLDQITPGIEVPDHLRHAWACAETPFMTFCHDDNFVVPSAVRAQVAFLRGHPDHVNCCGLVSYIRTGPDRTTCFVGDIDTLDQDDPLARFAHFLGRHWNAEFGTWRTAATRAAGPAFSLYRVDEGVGEAVSTGVCALLGKFHVLPRLSVIFSLHGANHGMNAAARKSCPILPEFAGKLDAVCRYLDEFCRDHGVKPPPDTRAYFMAAYLRFMGTWSQQFDAIADRLQSGVAPADTPRDMSAVEAQAYGLMCERLLRLTPEQLAAIEAMRSCRDARIRPSTGELFVVLDDDVVVTDARPGRPASGTVAPEAPPYGLPAPYDRVAEQLLSPEWFARYDAFVDGIAREFLGVSADAPGVRGLLDATFLRALVRLVLPLDARRPDWIDHLARQLVCDAPCSPARDALLAAVDCLDACASPELSDEGVGPLTAIGRGDRNRRIFLGRPPAGSTALPFLTKEVTRSQGMAFVPLVFDDRLRRMIEAGHRIWLRVEVDAVQGRMQFSLLCRGKLELLVSVAEGEGPRVLHFPIRTLETEYLVMRDITRGRTGQCTLSRLSWLAARATAQAGIMDAA